MSANGGIPGGLTVGEGRTVIELPNSLGGGKREEGNSHFRIRGHVGVLVVQDPRFRDFRPKVMGSLFLLSGVSA